MRRKQDYHRTAALLGAQPRQISTGARRQRRPVRIPWKAMAALVLGVGFLGWLGLASSWYVTAERLHIAGASSTTLAREIALTSELLDCHGLFLRESGTAELLVDQYVGLIAARVECQRFPAECIIYVEEREPVLTWLTEGQMYWIDAEGVMFSAHEMRPELPQVRGSLDDAMTSRRLLAVLQGVEALMALNIPSNELEYNPDRGLVWTDTEGRRVAFGVGEEMPPRWAMYLAVIAHVEARQIFPWAIDVQFPGGPTYSLDRTW